MQNQEFPKYYNMMIMAWSGLVFGAIALGGLYLLARGYWLYGALAILVGVPCAYFCLRQAQLWSKVDPEEIPRTGIKSFRDFLKGRK